jgi:(1->4)-alpha-D-glucan 1-alpha-D-glucosylmutase
MTCPGVPDFYQGTELWDLNLVDPDNRRPVDYKLRHQWLKEMKAAGQHEPKASYLGRLLADPLSPRLKLYLIYCSLNFRRSNPALFLSSSYEPLTVEGRFAEHLCAFARIERGQGIVVIVPRLLATLLAGELRLPLKREVWGDTWIRLPPGAAGQTFRNIFTNEMARVHPRNAEPGFRAADLFDAFPVVLLEQSD